MDKILADAQALVAEIQAIPPVPPTEAKTVTSITVNFSDGTTANFTPAQ